MKPCVSVIVCSYNEERNIRQCILSILNQDFFDIEMVLIDDCSTDSTREIARQFSDKRLHLHFLEKRTANLARLRNIGIKDSRGDFVFFTDADCVVDRRWITEGLRSFGEGYSGVQGKIIFFKKNIALSDKFPNSSRENNYFTGNISYRKDVLDKVNGFDEEYKVLEDRELALRILQFGAIGYNEMMIVTHLEKKYSVSGFFKEASSVQYKVKLVKKYDDCAGVDGNILNIKYFLLAFFPFLILAPVFMHRVRTGKDLLLLFLLWPKALYMRYWIWKSALKEEAFII